MHYTLEEIREQTKMNIKECKKLIDILRSYEEVFKGIQLKARALMQAEDMTHSLKSSLLHVFEGFSLVFQGGNEVMRDLQNDIDFIKSTECLIEKQK